MKRSATRDERITKARDRFTHFALDHGLRVEIEHYAGRCRLYVTEKDAEQASHFFVERTDDPDEISVWERACADLIPEDSGTDQGAY